MTQKAELASTQIVGARQKWSINSLCSSKRNSIFLQ